MTLAIRLVPETLRTIPYTTIAATAAYSGVGTSFAHPIRIILIQNLTDELMIYSFDGVNDHVALPASGFLLLDVTTNKTIMQGCFIAEGQRIYVRYESALPTSGAVYVSVFYAAD